MGADVEASAARRESARVGTTGEVSKFAGLKRSK